ncbi:MAG: PAS domain S-box protein [Sphingomonadales bacterium]
MSGRLKLAAVVVAIAVTTASILGMILWMLYQAALEQERERLIEIAQVQAHLIDEFARSEQNRGASDAFASTLEKIRGAHRRDPGFARTGEFVIATQAGDKIVFLLRDRQADLEKPDAIHFSSPLAEPMRRALLGQQGVIVGPDYRGQTVLAAYSRTTVLDLGVVAKIDLEEVRAPFRQGGLITGAAALILVFLLAMICRRIGKSLFEQYLSSERKFHDLVENSVQGIVILQNHLVKHANEAAAYIFGYPLPELIGTPMSKLIAAGDIDRLLATEAQTVDAALESRGIYSGQSEIWLSALCRRIDWEGKPATRMTIVDITELKKRGKELGEREAHINAIMDNVVDGIVTIDKKGIIKSFNKSASGIFGYDEHEVLGRNVTMLMPEPHTTLHGGYISRYLSTGEARVIGIGREVTALRKDGSEFPMDLGVGTFVSHDEITFIGTLRDLSEIKKTERQLQHAQKMEAVGQLTGGIAHDFNNLLAVVLGNLELLGDELGDNQRLNERIQQAMNAANRGVTLTHRLLAFSRKQVLNPQSTNVNELIDSMLDILRSSLGETIEIEFNGDDTLWPTHIDPDQLENALLNLAVNARDAMPDGGKLIIETENAKLDECYAREHSEVVAGEYTLLAVSDTGCGMAPAVLQHIMEPFFTTKPAGKGSGLGLAMIYGFVKQSGGHINIYSEVGIGTTVRIYLPRWIGSRTEAVTTEQQEKKPAGQGEKILVVEDNPQVRQLVVFILDSLGYQTLEAEDGAAALSALKTNRDIGLIFTDLVLPGGMSGTEMVRRAHIDRPDIKVLYTSGYTADAIAQHEELHEGADIIVKPYRRAALARKLRAVLNRSSAAA